MKKLSSIAILVFAVLLTGANSPAQATISASKRALIKELNEVTGAKEATDQILESFISAQEQESAKTLETIFSVDKVSSEEEKKEMLRKAKVSYDRVMNKFRDYFSTELNLGSAMDEISYTIYDKYFTEDELKDLIVFYKSPTGKKAMTVTPKIFADSMTLFSEKYGTKIQEFAKKTLDSEMTELKKELNPPSSKPQK